MCVLAQAHSFQAFYPYLLVYMILYMPTLAWVNAISFRQMENPSKHFSKIRIWGTIGWIIAGLVISYAFSWDSAVGVSRGLLKEHFPTSGAAPVSRRLYPILAPPAPPRGGPRRGGLRRCLHRL